MAQVLFTVQFPQRHVKPFENNATIQALAANATLKIARRDPTPGQDYVIVTLQLEGSDTPRLERARANISAHAVRLKTV